MVNRIKSFLEVNHQVLCQSSGPYQNLSKFYNVRTWGISLSSGFPKILIGSCIKFHCWIKKLLPCSWIRFSMILEIKGSNDTDLWFERLVWEPFLIKLVNYLSKNDPIDHLYLQLYECLCFLRYFLCLFPYIFWMKSISLNKMSIIFFTESKVYLLEGFEQIFQKIVSSSRMKIFKDA